MSAEPLASLARTARLFGRLLVRELDAATLRELQQHDVRSALQALGIELPEQAQLDEIAHAWLRCFLHPEGSPPPVQSLVTEGAYDGNAAAAVRKLADAAGLELAPGARNAPPDQIGCILWLWAELVGPRPELAAALADRHMAWAEPVLRRTAECTVPFYPAVAAATLDLLREIRDSKPPGSPTADQP